METIFILVILLAVVYKLGLFGPISDLSDVATRESSAYNREHKVKVAKRYESMATELDAKKINDNISTIDSLKFN